MAPTLYLIDGTALAYRSHFAFANSPLTGPDGRPTGAVFGYTSSLVKLLEEVKPDRAVVAFDGPKKTFRHQLHPAYKATREKTPEELIDQFQLIKDVTRSLGLALCEQAGIEADDLIGTLARRGEQEGYQVHIVSGDKDFAQLVSAQVHIYNIFTRGAEAEILDPAGVQEKWGVTPERFCDYLALIGDTSDNIPGVPGVGPKTAVKFINSYSSFEDVLQLGPGGSNTRAAKNLAEFADQARLAYRLVTILTDLDLPTGTTALTVAEPDKAALQDLYQKLGFTSLLASMAEDADSTADEQDYRTVDTEEALADLADRLRKTKTGFALDTETTSVKAMQARLVGISFSTETALAFYIPLNRGGTEWHDLVVRTMAPILADQTLPKWGQNIKYDMLILARAGMPVSGIAFDTMVASYCTSPESRSHGLDALSMRYLGYRKIPTEDVIGKGKNQVTMAQVTIPVVSQYACEDADYTARLVHVFQRELEKNGREELFKDLEMPLVPVLAAMEMEGVRVDNQRLGVFSTELDQHREDIRSKVFEIAGREFNLNSPQQVAEILFDELEVHLLAGGKKPKKTKTGRYSTSASVLEKYAPYHEVIQKLLKYRELNKLKTTYVDVLPQLAHPETGRIHTSFNQAVTATGRLSSSDPNLQNIPIRTEEGRRVRACFVPRAEDWKLLSLDYSQIELRVMAHLSRDEHLLETFATDQDIHRRTAALVMNKDEDAVTPLDRSRAKAINFGILYGMGARRLAETTGLTRQEATQFIENYFAALPGVKQWLEETTERARQEEQVFTLFGRRRPLPEINSRHDRIRVGAEHMAVNTPIQGPAADIMKKAMIDVDELIRRKGYKSRAVLQVHDEILFDCPADEVDQLRQDVTRTMENTIELAVPLKVDAGVGNDWLEAH